jgi:hypothetical protein
MSTPSQPVGQANKTVVAFLDGRREKGYIYNFSALKGFFTLFPKDGVPGQEGTIVDMTDLKAVFFVHDFVGNREYQDIPGTEKPRHGRNIEVIFRDGEKLKGRTEAYNPEKLGFFMFPADPKSNNIRIFVVSKNAVKVRFI